MRILAFRLARSIVAGIICLSWPLAIGGQELMTVQYVSDPTAPVLPVFVDETTTQAVATLFQPNTGTVQSTFYFAEDAPLDQVTLKTAPNIGDSPGAKYLPEQDPQEPRTIIDIQTYAPSGNGGGTSRGWPGQFYAWDAPNFFHRPLYFEQPNLERYGHYRKSWRLQSAISTAHFFAAIPALPVKMCVDKPCERVYTLGHFRPGNCNPHFRYKIK